MLSVKPSNLSFGFDTASVPTKRFNSNGSVKVGEASALNWIRSKAYGELHPILALLEIVLQLLLIQFMISPLNLNWNESYTAA